MRGFLNGAMTHRLLALVVLAVAASLSLPSHAAAQTNSVSWDQGQPVPGKRQVTGQGSYTTAQGWFPTQVSMQATPVNGGPNPPITIGGQPAAGNWGPVIIQGLAKGQYVVSATIVFMNKAGNLQSVSSPIAIVNVQ